MLPPGEMLSHSIYKSSNAYEPNESKVEIKIKYEDIFKREHCDDFTLDLQEIDVRNGQLINNRRKYTMAGRIDRATLIGKSGKPYPFKFHPLNIPLRGIPKFRDDSGVYVFAKEKHNNDTGFSEYDAVYVGQTESFEDRLVQTHSHWECANRHGCNSIGILEMPDSSINEREDIETDIISKHDPPCNKTP